MRPRGERGTWAGGAGAGASGRPGRGRVPGEARTGRAWAGEAGAPGTAVRPGSVGAAAGLARTPTSLDVPPRKAHVPGSQSLLRATLFSVVRSPDRCWL